MSTLLDTPSLYSDLPPIISFCPLVTPLCQAGLCVTFRPGRGASPVPGDRSVPGVPGITGVPRVLGVLGVPGVLGVSGVPGVPEVPGVFGVPGVL